MYELTMGELRSINESTNVWKMLIRRIQDSMEHVPSPVTDRIKELEELYIRELQEYYPNAKENDPSKDLDDIAAEFDELWDGKHPEFYDVRKLFAECDTKELAKAEEAIKDAERYLGFDAGK